MTWHVDDQLLTAWVDGTDGAIAGASVEQHLLHCDTCRARVPKPAALDDVWMRVRDEVELPQPSWIERLLTSVGVRATDARVVAVSPAFRAAWLTGLAVVLCFAVAAAMWADTRGQWVFVLIAPLVPAVGVALGYDGDVDPSVEAECATPYSGLRMVLLRSLVLVVTAAPVLLGVSLVLPGNISFLWLAPAATLTVAVLAASTWVPALQACGALGLSWLGVTAALGRDASPDDVLTGGFLTAYLAISLLAVGVLLMRRARVGEALGGAS